MLIPYSKTHIQGIFVLWLMLLFSLPVVSAETEEKLGEGMVNPGYHDKPAWFKESFLDIREDNEEAKAQNKRLMLYFYQDGCPYCSKLLRDNFGDRQISKTTQQYFDVVAINMWGDREVVDFLGLETTEKAFAKKLKVQFTPTLLYLNEAGEVLLRVNGYFEPHKFLASLNYIGQKQEKKTSLRDFFLKSQPEKASGKLHDDVATLRAVLKQPLDLQKANTNPGSKPLLVMFEQKTCRSCDDLHLGILKKKQVIPSLQAFDIAVLDMWSDDEIITADGQRLKISDWSKQLNIQYAPSLVFFDKQGAELFRTEAFLRTFHVKAALDYVSTQAYKDYPEFQRYVQKLADDLHAQGIEFDLMD